MHYCPERILKPAPYCKAGHLSVTLRRKGRGIAVHKLVMLAFMGEPPAGMEVLHRNGDPTDNRLGNLHYGTRTENIIDTYTQKGRWRKLTTDDVREIRKRIEKGNETLAQIGKDYSVGIGCISSIKCGRTYWWLK